MADQLELLLGYEKCQGPCGPEHEHWIARNALWCRAPVVGQSFISGEVCSGCPYNYRCPFMNKHLDAMDTIGKGEVCPCGCDLVRAGDAKVSRRPR